MLRAPPLGWLLLPPPLGCAPPPRIVSKSTGERLTAILAVLLTRSCLSESITTESITTNRLHQWRAGPRRIWLPGLRIERCPLLRVELRIVHGILLLGFVVSHRLFSLRWLAPLSPQ